MIRVLILGVIALIVAWSGYWLVGSNSHKKSVVELLESLEQQDWVVEYSTIGVRGFPNRFDIRIENVNLSHPSGEISWHSPWIDILMLSYNFNHAIIVLPPPQAISIGNRQLSLPAQKVKASIEVSSTDSFALEQLIVELTQNEAIADGSISETGGYTILAVRAHPEAANTYDISLHTKGRTVVGPQSPAASVLENLAALIPFASVDATAELADPVDRSSCSDRPVAVERVEIKAAGLATETYGVELRGNLAVNDGYNLEGEVQSTVRGIDELLLQVGTWLDLSTVQMMLLNVALQAISGEASSVEVNLEFTDTGMRIGRFLEIERFLPATLC